MHKKGPRGPFLGKRFLKTEGEALEEGALWQGTVTLAPAQESDTAPFRPGFYRVDSVAGRVYVKAWPAERRKY